MRYGRSLSNMSACQRNPARASSREVCVLGVQRGLSQPCGWRPRGARQHIDTARDVVALRLGGEIGRQRALAPAMRRHHMPARGNRRRQVGIALGDHAAGVEHRAHLPRAPADPAAARRRPSGRIPPRTAPANRPRPASAGCPSDRCPGALPSAQPSSITLTDTASGRSARPIAHRRHEPPPVACRFPLQL